MGRGGVGGLGEGDGDGGGGSPRAWTVSRIRLGCGEAEDFEGGQAELAARGDGEGLEEVEVFQGMVRVERDELGPVVAARAGDGGGDDAEVLAGVVGADVEEAVPMGGVVLLVVEARGE